MLRRALATTGRRSFSSKICSDVTQAIGATPMVQLNRIIGPHMKAKRVLAKLEMQNPGGSVKDRIAKDMIEKAEARGEISPGKTTIVEVTSGNTGIGLAMVCAAKGYPFVCVMSEAFSIERRKMMRFLGAKVVLTNPAHKGSGMVIKARELEKRHGWFRPRQFESEANAWVHRETTAPEILASGEGAQGQHGRTSVCAQTAMASAHS